MSKNVEIVEYRDEYKESCIDLLEKTFTSEDNYDAFEWRFETKRKTKPIIVCAIDGNKVISFNSWLPWEFLYNGKIFTGYQSGKSATDVNYRKRGIFGKILRKADELFKEKSIDFLFGFPGSMSFGSFYKAGYFPIGLLNFRIRLLSPFKKKKNTITDIKQHDLINEGYPLILIDSHKITPVFSNDYVQWRYLNNPKHFKFVPYNENNNKALFIIRERRYRTKYHFKINELLLLDCQFSSFNPHFIKNAIQYLSQTCAGKATYIKTFFNPTSDRGRILSKYFPLKLGSKNETLILKQINPDLDYSSFFNFYHWDVFPHIKDVN